MVKPKFRFDVSMDAARYNFNLLKENNFNLEDLLNTPGETSVTTYGSEFKTTKELEKLFILHPRWEALKQRLNDGSTWDFKTITEENRLKDLSSSIKRGNHVSAKIHKSFLSDALSKEIKKGWELILPLDKARHIPGLVLSPMGVAEQIGVSDSGTFVPKKRLTHDLSFPGKHTEESINSLVIEDSLEPCMFGHCFLRLIHKIVQLRELYPSKRRHRRQRLL